MPVEPGKGFSVDEVGGILRAQAVVLSVHGVEDVAVQGDAHGAGVALGGAIAVEKIGVVEVRLELADVAVELINAALVGGGMGTFVTACPFAEHPGGVAVAFHDFRQDKVAGAVRLLPDDGVVGIVAVFYSRDVTPILLVAADVSVSGVLPGHQGGAGRGADGAAGVCLGETHAFLCQAVDVGGEDVFLPVAGKVAIPHVITQDKDDVRFVLLCGLCSGC